MQSSPSLFSQSRVWWVSFGCITKMVLCNYVVIAYAFITTSAFSWKLQRGAKQPCLSLVLLPCFITHPILLELPMQPVGQLPSPLFLYFIYLSVCWKTTFFNSQGKMSWNHFQPVFPVRGSCSSACVGKQKSDLYFGKLSVPTISPKLTEAQ